MVFASVDTGDLHDGADEREDAEKRDGERRRIEREVAPVKAARGARR